MAKSDYRCCDVCGSKVFYDAHLNYNFDECMADGSPKLDYLGDWVVICDECSEMWKCVVLKREIAQEGTDAT